MCGQINYPLSMGGPGICPACDCGIDPGETRARREAHERIYALEQEVSRLKAANSPPLTESAAQLIERIQSYLENGGMFNPELMEHEKVRKLLLDCREYITNHPC